MTETVLCRKTLNRCLLQRQLLLTRSPLSAAEAIEQLAGLQAQSPQSPYFALWSRLRSFRPEQLSSLLAGRDAVRIALMRSTLHLVSSRDAASFRQVLAPVLERALKGSFGKQLEGVDRVRLQEQARALLKQEPLTPEQLGHELANHWPRHEPSALANGARNTVPLVQLPPRGLWKQGGPSVHAVLEDWLGLNGESAAAPDPGMVVKRYLRAFGPASVKDMAVWSGLAKLQPVIGKLGPELRAMKDERGVQLYDLPDGTIPDPDTVAPPRFLSEFDNMLLSFHDRSRIMDEAFKPLVFTNNGIIRSTFLLDGFVQGTWSIEAGKKQALLRLKPFRLLGAEEREGLLAEGGRLLEFAHPDVSHDVQWD